MIKYDTVAFAAAIEREVFSQVKSHPEPVKSTLSTQFAIMFAGVLLLLGLCVLAFEGSMVPAMWQLTSMIWMWWRVPKILR